MFRPALTAQLAAYLIYKAGGTISHVKLVILLYLVDRTYLLKFGSLLTGDTYVALSEGPALSKTIYTTLSMVPEWQTLFAKVDNDHWQLTNQNLSIDQLDLLNQASEDIVTEVYAKYAHLSQSDLCALCRTTKVCPEWRDPGRSLTRPISYEDVLRCYGHTQAEASAQLQAIKEEAYSEFVAQMI